MKNRKKSYLQPSKRVALTAMFSALGLLFLYAAAILPAGRLGMYAICAFFVAGLASEKETALAWMQYVVVSALGAILVPDWTKTLPYILFFGHYAILKYYIESKIRRPLWAWALKFAVFNGCMAVVMLIVQNVIFPRGLTIPLWVVIVLGQAAFLAYDIVFTGVIRFYEDNIRRWLFR